MYKIYEKVLNEKGLKNADVAKGTGISNMTLSDWKRGVSTPKTDKLQKIADFLNISLIYLTTGTENNISEQELKILNLYKCMNESGRERLEEYAEFLTQKYKNV